MGTQHALHTLPAFPVYSLGFITDDKLLLGGGGGATRSGIKNKLVGGVVFLLIRHSLFWLQRLYNVDEAGALELATELELEKDEDVPMSMAVDYQVCRQTYVSSARSNFRIQANTVICGINGSMEKVEAGINPHCRAFSIEMKDDMKPL